MFMDSAMEHPAVAPAGLFSDPIVLLKNNDSEGRFPASVHQFPRNGAPDDSSPHNANIIRVHRAGFLIWILRSFKPCSGQRGAATTLAAQQSGVRTILLVWMCSTGACAWLTFTRTSTATFCLSFAGAGVRLSCRRSRRESWS